MLKKPPKYSSRIKRITKKTVRLIAIRGTIYFAPSLSLPLVTNPNINAPKISIAIMNVIEK